MTKLTTEEFSTLHKQIAQLVADFLKDKELPPNSWAFAFSIDDLANLQKYGTWTPYNDSYIGITDDHGQELLSEM